MGDGKVYETAAAGVVEFKKAVGLEFEGDIPLKLAFRTNPSVGTLERIADALGGDLKVVIA